MGDAMRDHVLMSERDAAALGVRDGDPLVLSNEQGEFQGRARVANVAPRHLVLYWPEANVLIPARYDPEAGIPDYNAHVRVKRG
jgi:anaerobic selenocysteine-containing dehydrogenase